MEYTCNRRYRDVSSDTPSENSQAAPEEAVIRRQRHPSISSIFGGPVSNSNECFQDKHTVLWSGILACWEHAAFTDASKNGRSLSERIRGVKSEVNTRLMLFCVYAKHTGGLLNTDTASGIEAQAHLKTREDDRQFSHPRSFLSLSSSSHHACNPDPGLYLPLYALGSSSSRHSP